MDPEKARQHVPAPSYHTYSSKDAILYALGIGANSREDLHFVYEGHTDFQVFPTFAVVPGLLANSLTDWPGIAFDLSRVLHAEQYIEVLAPFPSDGTRLRSETRVSDVLDKGKAALILSEVSTYDDQSGQKLAVQQFVVFQGGAGNFGGNRNSPAERKVSQLPEGRAPDAVMEERVGTDQAALYRLGSGDLNPLHIDPDFARMAKFPRPILHGLCSLGIAVRHVLQTFGANCAANFRSVKVRFSAPVEPGQHLAVEMWRVGNRVLFQAKVKETGAVALSSGCVELNAVLPNEQILAAKVQQQDSAVALQSAEIFRVISAELNAHNEKLKSVGNALVLYEITNNGGKLAREYTVELANGTGRVYEGRPSGDRKPTVTVRVDDADFVQLVNGRLDGTKAFLSGRLKVRGNLGILQKLQMLMKREKGRSKI